MDQHPPALRGSRFFAVTAIAIALLVVASFPVTYFMPLATGAHFTLLRHLHGLAFFGWIGLYVAQTLLVRAGRIRQHRGWGQTGIWLAGAMLPLGLWQAVTSAGERQTKGVALPFEFTLYNLVDICVFTVAFGWGIVAATQRIEWHRRLMFIAVLNLFGPAFSRVLLHLPLPYPWLDMTPNLAADALLVALAVHDRRPLGRVHAVTVGAMALLIPLHAVEPLIARSAAWTSIAPRLFGF
ncbi:hypothetical protein [Sphingomonas sp.]|uniref:hypothetical protein n=1 Tax=Sphingomonas sp. TaxID=28214 RepID=UPI003CC527C8